MEWVYNDIALGVIGMFLGLLLYNVIQLVVIYLRIHRNKINREKDDMEWLQQHAQAKRLESWTEGLKDFKRSKK